VIYVTGSPTIGSPQLVAVQYKNWNPKDNLTMIYGNHTIKTGVDLSWESKDENAANLTPGRYGFTGYNGTRRAHCQARPRCGTPAET